VVNQISAEVAYSLRVHYLIRKSPKLSHFLDSLGEAPWFHFPTKEIITSPTKISPYETADKIKPEEV
jgi:hypothetical protein